MKGWTWAEVALQYAALVSKEEALLAPLGKDPFASRPFTQPTASWHSSTVKLLSGYARDLAADSKPLAFNGSMLYALYVDTDIQVSRQAPLKAPIFLLLACWEMAVFLSSNILWGWPGIQSACKHSAVHPARLPITAGQCQCKQGRPIDGSGRLNAPVVAPAE